MTLSIMQYGSVFLKLLFYGFFQNKVGHIFYFLPTIVKEVKVFLYRTRNQQSYTEQLSYSNKIIWSMVVNVYSSSRWIRSGRNTIIKEKKCNI